MFGNVVTQAVTETQAKLDALDAEKRAALDADMTLDMDEWFIMGDMASRAMLAGKIDQDTAVTLHAIHTDFNNGATLAQRVVFLRVAGELLAAGFGTKF